MEEDPTPQEEQDRVTQVMGWLAIGGLVLMGIIILYLLVV